MPSCIWRLSLRHCETSKFKLRHYRFSSARHQRRLLLWVSDVGSESLVTSPLCPRKPTKCGVAANRRQGHQRESSNMTNNVTTEHRSRLSGPRHQPAGHHLIRVVAAASEARGAAPPCSKACGLVLGLSPVAWKRHPLPNDCPAKLLSVHPGALDKLSSRRMPCGYGASQRVVNNNIAINTTIAAANEKNTVCIIYEEH